MGSVAPDFEAAGTSGKTYRLSEQRGHIVLLVFYPGDDTAVCTRQLTSYSKKPAIHPDHGVVTWALSPQDVESHEHFAAAHNLTMPLLHDKDKNIGALYNVLGPLGFYRRSAFVIDPDGIVQFARRGAAGLGYPDADVLQEAINQITDTVAR